MCQPRSKMTLCKFSAWQKLPFILLPFNFFRISHPRSINFSAKQNTKHKEPKTPSSWVNNDKWSGRSRRLVAELGKLQDTKAVKLTPHPPTSGPGLSRLDRRAKPAFSITETNQNSFCGPTESQQAPSTNRSTLSTVGYSFRCSI